MRNRISKPLCASSQQILRLIEGWAWWRNEAGNIAQAAEDYEKSVELQPTPVGYLLLGRALELGGQPEAARAAQSQAVSMTQDLNDDVATARQLLAN